MRADDAPHLMAIFAALSPQSRYLRFHEPLEAPDPALVEVRAQEMVEMTLRHGHGWLAFARRGNRRVPIGGVRWVRVPASSPDEPPQAEVAVTVCDAFQGQGIGRRLIQETHRAAGLETTLILLAAPGAQTYYPHIGMELHHSCWILRSGKTLTDGPAG
jgi:predicted N-acetyltransferase YhbS